MAETSDDELHRLQETVLLCTSTISVAHLQRVSDTK